MSRLRTRILPAAIAAGIGVVAVFVFRPEPRATWLRVEAAAVLVAGEPYRAHVTLLEPADGWFLDFDLHGHDGHKQPLRCVAVGGARRVTAGERSHNFTLELPDRPEVQRVHAVIYLSTTGNWSDAVRVAKSEPFAVVRDATRETDRTARTLVVREQREDPAIEIPNPPGVRATIAAIWSLGALAAWTARRRAGATRGSPVLPILLVAITAWELVEAGAWIEQAGRSLARAADLYEGRRGFQQVATVAALCTVGGFAAVGLRRRSQRVPALTLAGLGVFGAVELAGMLSLHEIDRVLAVSCGPVPLAAVVRGGAACLALAGIARRRSRPAD